MKDLRNTIARTLRLGVTVSFVLTLLGGVVYLLHHGGEAAPDYSTFNGPSVEYTTLRGILGGAFHLTAYGLIQIGVVALLLTPIMRVVLSLFDFVRQHDWLYATITSIVLAVILVNSLSSPL